MKTEATIEVATTGTLRTTKIAIEIITVLRTIKIEEVEKTKISNNKTKVMMSVSSETVITTKQSTLTTQDLSLNLLVIILELLLETVF